jgi:hypothetical protein
MTRHLKRCSVDHEPSRGKPTRLFHLRVEDAYSPIFWLDLEMEAGATLADLDVFLREIWLECCGHLSAFDIEGTTYLVPYAETPLMGDFADRTMNVRLEEALATGTRFYHTYDFGTSTELKLRVVSEREGRIGGREPLRILSRNEDPVWPCALCGQSATQLCTYCMYEQENPFYCEAHAEDHDCDEEMLLPVVNSPRMGVCGYTGPL